MFSSLRCPFVASWPKADETPALTAFAGYGVVMGRQLQPGTPLRLGYFEPVDTVPHTEMRRRYTQSLVDDPPDTSRPRLRWSDDEEGLRRLAQCSAEDARTLLEMHNTAPAFPSVATVWCRGKRSGTGSFGHIDLTTDPKLLVAARSVLSAAIAARHLDQDDRSQTVIAAAETARATLVR